MCIHLDELQSVRALQHVIEIFFSSVNAFEIFTIIETRTVLCRILHIAEHMSREHAGEHTLPVRVWFHRYAQEKAQRESYATLIEEKKRDGGAEFTLYSYSLEWTAQWLLSFGDRAEAVAPAKLRALVRAAAEKIAAKHG